MSATSHRPLAIVDNHPLCEQTLREVEALTAHGVAVALLSPRERGGRPSGLPVRCAWHPLPDTQLHEMLSVLGPFSGVHSHCALPLMARAALAAWRLGIPFYRDFNEVLIERERVETAPPDNAQLSLFTREQHWQQPLNANERHRIAETVAMAPRHVRSVLDVGCGDGRITNQLVGHYPKVVGYDGSAVALRYVQTETRLGPVDQLPFADSAFDLLCCIEVIEHLPADALQRCLRELARVSDQYILLGVPLRETLGIRDIRCSRCGHRYNQTGHLRIFKRSDMRNLVPGYSLCELRECGAPKRFYYNRILLRIRKGIGGLQARTPHTVCPACGTELAPTGLNESNGIGRLCDRANNRIRRLVPFSRSHILALYRRTG